MTIKANNHVLILAPYGKLDEVLEWCGKFCTGTWDLVTVQEQAGYSSGAYEFSFEEEVDVTHFELRWG